MPVEFKVEKFFENKSSTGFSNTKLGLLICKVGEFEKFDTSFCSDGVLINVRKRTGAVDKPFAVLCSGTLYDDAFGRPFQLSQLSSRNYSI